MKEVSPMAQIKTNKEDLAVISLLGKIHHPLSKGNHFRINGVDSKVICLPGTGGITYNIGVGDSVYKFKGDHLEPSVTIRNEDSNENNALMLLGCCGNEAIVVSGDAKGAKGYVLGGHGGIEHTIIEFSKEDKEKMCIDDKILVKGCGQGLEIQGFEDTVVSCGIDPVLLDNMEIEIVDGNLVVPVVATVPAYLMGSGLGSSNSHTGDYDIMTTDKKAIKELGLDTLCFGDFVLIDDHTNTVGRAYKKGASTIGIVVHGDSYGHGHGPGITTLLTSNLPIIKAKIDKSANIKNYIGK